MTAKIHGKHAFMAVGSGNIDEFGTSHKYRTDCVFVPATSSTLADLKYRDLARNVSIDYDVSGSGADATYLADGLRGIRPSAGYTYFAYDSEGQAPAI